MPFQRRNWLAERVAWVCLAALLLAAALGVFGSGVLARAHKATDSGALTADYEQALRRDAPATLTVTLGSPAEPLPSQTTLSIEGDLLTRAHIDRITPQPESMRSDRQVLDVVLGTQQTGHSKLRIDFRPTQPGPLHTSLSWSDQHLDISHFVYP